MRLSVWSEVQMICIWPSWCDCHPITSCSSKIQNGLPFWCRLTQVVWKVVVVVVTAVFRMKKGERGLAGSCRFSSSACSEDSKKKLRPSRYPPNVVNTSNGTRSRIARAVTHRPHSFLIHFRTPHGAGIAAFTPTHQRQYPVMSVPPDHCVCMW